MTHSWLWIYKNHVTSVALFSVLVPEILVFVCWNDYIMPYKFALSVKGFRIHYLELAVIVLFHPFSSTLFGTFQSLWCLLLSYLALFGRWLLFFSDYQNFVNDHWSDCDILEISKIHSVKVITANCNATVTLINLSF